jgi:hypothetical protein
MGPWMTRNAIGLLEVVKVDHGGAGRVLEKER